MPKTKREPLRSEAEAAKLVEDNRGLVGLVLKGTRHPERLRDELEAAGLVGLWKAARLFDASLGFAFSTYAVKGIRWAIRHELRREWDEREGEVASLDDVADGFDAGDRHPEARDDGERDRRESWESFAPYLPRLTPREREVVGLLADGLSVSEAAARLGVTPQRVRQVRDSAARRIERLAAGRPLREPRADASTAGDAVAACVEEGEAGVESTFGTVIDPLTPRLLSADAVAALLAISKRTLWRLVQEGRFPDATFRVNRKLVRGPPAAVGAGRAVTGEPAPTAPCDLLTPKAAARLLGVHAGTVCRFARDGRLKCRGLAGGRWRFAREDVLALLRPSQAEAS